MENRVEDFASRDDPILLHKDSEGDYIAEIPDLPGCMTDAKTKEEALRQIEDAKRSWIALALEKGVTIPEPRDLDEQPSGKLLVRLPRSLHRSLQWHAEQEGVSLNQCIVFLLTNALTATLAQQAQAPFAGLNLNLDPDVTWDPYTQLDIRGAWSLGFRCPGGTRTYGRGLISFIDTSLALDDAKVDVTPMRIVRAQPVDALKVGIR